MPRSVPQGARPVAGTGVTAPSTRCTGPECHTLRRDTGPGAARCPVRLAASLWPAVTSFLAKAATVTRARQCRTLAGREVQVGT